MPSTVLKPDALLARRAFLSRAGHTTGAAFAGIFALRAERFSRLFGVAVEQPRGLAAGPDGTIAVGAGGSVLLHAAGGRLLRKVNAGQSVSALCFDPRGRLFACTKDRVLRLNESGEFASVGQPVSAADASLTGLAVTDHGELFAADSGQRTIWRMDTTGKVIGQIKPSDRGFAVTPACFPIAWRNNRLLVAEPARHRVHSYSAAGERLATWGAHSRGTEGFSGCCNPVALAARADGSVVTVEAGQPRVKVFTAEGKFARLLAGPQEFATDTPATASDSTEAAGCAQGLFDVAVSPDGRVLVLDRNSREVRVLA